MLYKIVKDAKFQYLMQKQMSEMIHFCFEKEQNFGILCQLDNITFIPELPEEIYNEFKDITLFFLAGYTFETAKIEENMLIFEAGFGEENIGSVVHIPLLSILQIIIDETPVLINVASPEDQVEEKSDAKVDTSGIQNSMSALLSNPENQKFKK
jgi:hypothetical protein